MLVWGRKVSDPEPPNSAKIRVEQIQPCVFRFTASGRDTSFQSDININNVKMYGIELKLGKQEHGLFAARGTDVMHTRVTAKGKAIQDAKQDVFTNEFYRDLNPPPTVEAEELKKVLIHFAKFCPRPMYFQKKQ